MTDNRDPDKIHYDRGLVRGSGIDADKFPELVPCTAVLGGLRADVAEALGLTTDVQVVAGSIDNTAAAIGAGAVEDFLPHLYIGTSSWLASHVPFKKTDLLASLASVPGAVPKRYLLTALQATAGGNLTFLRDNILYHRDELLSEENVPDVFKIFDRIAARGAAWIAAVGLGVITFSDVPELVEFKRSYAPTAENRQLYDDRFAVFTRIYKQMKGIYHRLNA